MTPKEEILEMTVGELLHYPSAIVRLLATDIIAGIERWEQMQEEQEHVEHARDRH